MTKKAILQREKKRELLCDRYYNKRSVLRLLSKKKNISFKERLDIYMQINSLGRDSSYVRKRNRCFVTGRARGYYRKFGLSRIKLREMYSWGYVPGMRKLSW